MMNYVVVLFLGICCLFITGNAQERVDYFQDGEKKFIKTEIERYKALFLRRPTEITAEDNINVTYYKLELHITTTPQYLSGKVTMNSLSTQNNLGALTLDLMNSLTIDSVVVGGTSVSFTQHSSTFDVTLDHLYNVGELITLETYYQGVPGSSGFGSFKYSTHASIPWVWSLSEPYGAKDWWPSKDHPADKADSADIIVTCDSTFKVGSNGKLISVTNNGDGTATYHWHEQYPITTYLISVAITNYEQFSNWFKYSPTDSMEILNYVLPEHLSSAMANLPRTVDMLTIYSNLFGLYPFINEKYGHSEFGWGGGMEHQTMTSLGGFGESLVAHELAHMWFGDMITCRTWPNIWLNEGFATFLTGLYYENKYSTNSYWNYMNSQMNSAKHAVGSIYVQDTSNVGTLFNGSLVYAKGATVLHMLRHILGDSVFFQSMYSYANDSAYKYGTASTADFQSVCESVSGKDLDYFFNEWIYGERYPKYAYTWFSNPTAVGYQITLSLSQTTGTSNPSFFTMPIDFRVTATSWDTTIVLFNDSISQTFVFNVSHNPFSIQLDPDGWILKDFISPFFSSPTSLNFGAVDIGVAKVDSVLVTNMGGAPIIITSVTSDLGDFTVTPTSDTILPSLSKMFYVTFSPQSSGSRTGHIIFTHNGSSSPDQILVLGFGIVPTMSISVRKLWNMISVPLTVSDPRKFVLFPSAISSALRYVVDSGYVSQDSLRNAVGYWLKFSNDENLNIAGMPRTVDTIGVTTGWNLIGSITYSLPTNAVIENPPGIVSSDYFHFNTSYRIADSIEPGKGFWVKVNQSGTLILDTSSILQKQHGEKALLEGFNSLEVRDGGGNFQVLYFGSEMEGININHYELPPIPPPGIFDARFASNRYLETVKDGESKEYPILISSHAYPITISWSLIRSDYASLRIGEKIVRLVGSGSILVTSPDAEVRLSMSSSNKIPKEFALEQNYPNPFNPSTTLKYQIPVESWVQLVIYNLLGQEVRMLVDERQDGGYKSVPWNSMDNVGNPISSGVYFYRLKATSVSEPGNTFIKMKKMFLIR